VYKIIGLIFFVGLGLITVIISASLVLFGIPFTIVHIDHLFNRKKVQISKNSTTHNEELQNQSNQIILICSSICLLLIRFETSIKMDDMYFDISHCWSCNRSSWL